MARDKVDDYVTRAQKGEAPAKPAPAGPEKPIWERSGMTYEEYQRGMRQRTEELKRSVVDHARDSGAERQSNYRR